MVAKPKRPEDPFAAEMRQRAEDRRQAHLGTFHEEWLERLSRPVAPIFQSSLHHHDEACLGEPHLAQVAGGVWITVRRCAKGGGHVEVPDALAGLE